MIKARIAITLKQSVLDPQGQAIETALMNNGFDHVHSVRQGKIIDICLNETSLDQAKADLQEMCHKLLANLVIENFDIIDLQTI